MKKNTIKNFSLKNISFSGKENLFFKIFYFKTLKNNSNINIKIEFH